MKKACLLTWAVLATGPSGVRAQEEELAFPEGWQVRFDHGSATMDELSLVSMPPGLHVTTGPALIAYHPDSTAMGDFRLESEVFLFDPEDRREGFGFFVGGADLEGTGQRYTYFLLRNGGQFLVKVRDGESTRTIQEWTGHPAIASWVGGDEATARNVLVLEAEGDELRFAVNGERVWTGERGALTIDGIVGLRVNHGLNLHVTTLMAKPIG